jgi:hypothetical protein
MDHQKDQAQKFTAYAFIAGLAIMLVGFVVWAVTGHRQPAVRIIVTAFWLAFAAFNANIFYTGRFTLKGGPTFTREHSPGMFYAFAIFFAVGSMSIATFLLWAAYFTN